MMPSCTAIDPSDVTSSVVTAAPDAVESALHSEWRRPPCLSSHMCLEVNGKTPGKFERRTTPFSWRLRAAVRSARSEETWRREKLKLQCPVLELR